MGSRSGRAQRSRRRSWVDMTVRPLYKPPARLGLWALEYAQVAQLVEHATENRSVGGSIPPLGTIMAVEDARWLIGRPEAGCRRSAAATPARPIAALRRHRPLAAARHG